MKVMMSEGQKSAYPVELHKLDKKLFCSFLKLCKGYIFRNFQLVKFGNVYSFSLPSQVTKLEVFQGLFQEQRNN